MWSLGVALQILAEFIGLHSASPRPRWVLFYPTWGAWQKANSDLDERTALIGSATWTESARQQRERFVYLKEASGNFAAASLVAAALALYSGAGLLSGNVLVLLVIATSLFLSHLVHAVRQARFEIKTLTKAGTLSDAEANAMLDCVKGLRRL